MKVLFLMPLALPAYLFQLAALSAFLKSKGHVVRYEELVMANSSAASIHFARVKDAVDNFKPDLIAFSSYEMSFEWIKDISDYIKSICPKIPIIVGGYYATLSAEDVLGHPSIDIICIGEGEYPLSELLDSLKMGGNRKDIQNLWFKEDTQIIKNPLRNLISNLDELPFVDRDLFTSENRRCGALEIMASRGCPFDCANCSNHALKKIYAAKGHYLRYRSAQHVLSEIESCLSKEDFKTIQFEDDMFTANKIWLKEFCGEYKKRFKLPFICNIRPESGTPETLNLLKDAGCLQVSIGLEAGDEKIRRQVLCRDMPDEVIIRVFKETKKIGIKRKSFNMVGLPHETPRTILKTIWMNLLVAPEAVQTAVYYPFKGTVLGDECYHNGWVDLERKRNLKLYANDSILNLPTLPRWFIRMAKWINSATALRSGNFSVIKLGFSVFFKSLPFHKRIAGTNVSS